MINDLILTLSILIGAFYLLIKSSDYLISSSTILGLRHGISKFVIGLTLVAIGTSLPELFTSLIAIFSSENSASFVLGTVIGSNITNILLVFGILLIFSKKFKAVTKLRDRIILMLTTILFSIVITLGKISFVNSIFFLVLFIGYLYIIIDKSKKTKGAEEEVDEIEDERLEKYSSKVLGLIFLVSLLGLNFGARGVIYGIENIGEILKIPIEFLTLTTVAFATSLPEIVVTYTSAIRREFDLAVGNIIGSNVSNILLIIGASGVTSTIFREGLTFNVGSYVIGIIFMVISALMLISVLMSKKAGKKTGYVFLLVYALYVFLLF